ncbi:MAG TPA: uroporphyrinogen-III C-methyltransferase [Burkholderiales bacterium]
MNAKVYLIGAGPGDPELMTLKGARALACADVVLIDDLVSRGCLAHARSGAKIVEVGKRGGCASTPQAFIEKLMIQYAKAGSVVARLKGGDPFVFGRGGEEMEALANAGVEVEVIPGVTAGTAVPGSLGIPVTHREFVRGVTFVTGHAREGVEPDWEALARSGTTLVIYMGLARVDRMVRALARAGMPADMPACIIQDGTLKTQKQRVTTLGRLSAHGFGSPSLIVIGNVVRFAARRRQPVSEKAA